LNSRGIDRLAHQPTQRINLAHYLTFGDTPDGRIAGHLAHCVEIGGQQSGSSTSSGGRGRGLGAGVSCSDHNDVVLIAVATHGFWV
jgi:hypothetical protein